HDRRDQDVEAEGRRDARDRPAEEGREERRDEGGEEQKRQEHERGGERNSRASLSKEAGLDLELLAKERRAGRDEPPARLDEAPDLAGERLRIGLRGGVASPVILHRAALFLDRRPRRGEKRRDGDAFAIEALADAAGDLRRSGRVAVETEGVRLDLDARPAPGDDEAAGERDRPASGLPPGRPDGS